MMMVKDVRAPAGQKKVTDELEGWDAVTGSEQLSTLLPIFTRLVGGCRSIVLVAHVVARW